MSKIQLGLITINDISLIDCLNNKNTVLLKITDELLNIKNTLSINNILVTHNLIYETDKYKYYSFYLLVNKDEVIELNKKAQSLSTNNESVYGNCIVMKTDYNDIIQSITIDEIEYLIDIKNKFIGYLITPENEIQQKRFERLILKDYSFNEPVLIKFVLFDYLIKMYLDIKPNNNKMNKIATGIFKNFIINGDVFICIVKMAQGKVTEYLNIDNNDILILLYLILEKDVNDQSLFKHQHSFNYSLYKNYNETENNIFGKQDKLMKNTVYINYIIFNEYLNRLVIDPDILNGPILQEHIDINKVHKSNY